MKEFRKKVVVITGAASGMGRAYAGMFARLGAYIAVCDVDLKGLEETTRMVKDLGCERVYSAPVNVADRAEVYRFADSVKQALGNAHVIVNNAGVEGSGENALRMSDEAMRRVMDINFWGVVHGTRAFLPQLLANTEGVVINVSSVFGLVSMPRSSDYCASKFAVRGWTECLMAELEGSRIQVHLVHPGGIATRIARRPRSQKFSSTFLKTSPEAFVQEVLKQVQKGSLRTVAGHMAGPVHFMSRYFPLKWIVRTMKKTSLKTAEPSDYDEYAPAMKDRFTA